MRWRVTYNLHTSAWHQYGLHAMAIAPTAEAAMALVERGLYARKDDILRERHDYAGDGFVVEITSATLTVSMGVEVER